MSTTTTLSLRARLLVAAVALVAHLPAVTGEFLYDDHRFVRENEAVHGLSPARVGSFFADPGTVATTGGEHMYRPLRTLDFAIDWTISGGRPWFFHARNIAYHAIAALLVLSVLARLVSARAAFFGALLFAAHPVHSESVGWISSRGDLLLACLFLGALRLHLSGRLVGACVLLLAALLAKEAAVVFAGAAFLADLHRRSRLRWGHYVTYAVIAGTYVLFWMQITDRAAEGAMTQTTRWLGGSYGATLVTAGKGFLYDVKLLLLPVQTVTDYYVPARAAMDAGAWISLGALPALAAAALLLARSSRFALLWFLVLIFPVSGIALPMSIPTAERFLLLPAVGVCLWGGGLLARTRGAWVVLAWAVVACFLTLTVERSLHWRDEDTLWRETNRIAAAPHALQFLSQMQVARAEETGDREKAEAVLEKTDRFFQLFAEDIHLGPPGEVVVPDVLAGDVLNARARAFLLLDRPKDALETSVQLARIMEPKHREAHHLASLALEKMGLYREAANAAQRAAAEGYLPEEMARRARFLRRLSR